MENLVEIFLRKNYAHDLDCWRAAIIQSPGGQPKKECFDEFLDLNFNDFLNHTLLSFVSSVKYFITSNMHF